MVKRDLSTRSARVSSRSAGPFMADPALMAYRADFSWSAFARLAIDQIFLHLVSMYTFYCFKLFFECDITHSATQLFVGAIEEISRGWSDHN